MAADSRHIQRLEKRLREGLQSRLAGTQLNGPADLAHRYPGNVNMSFAYVEGESLIMGLKVRLERCGSIPLPHPSSGFLFSCSYSLASPFHARAKP